MAKAEISWKRVNEEGLKLQVYAQHVGKDCSPARNVTTYGKPSGSRHWKTGSNCSMPSSASSTVGESALKKKPA